MADTDLVLTAKSQKLIKQLADAGKLDFRPILKVLGISYRKEVAQIFDRKQSRGEGLRWAPLSEKYAEQKEKEWPGGSILVRSGSLLASMTVEGATGNISLISKFGAVFGSSIRYGVYHDEGTSRMPKRNFSIPSVRRMEIWKKDLTKNIVTQLNQNGIEVKEDTIFESKPSIEKGTEI